MENNTDNIGNIKISEEVVAIIAGIATSEVKGVAGMAGSIAGGIAELLGKKNISKGVKVDLNDPNVSIDLHIIVEYGARVPEVAWEAQEKVKKSVESMTGLNVENVNIYVEGVYIEKEPKKETKPPANQDALVKEKESEKESNKDSKK